MNQGSIK